MTFVEGETKPAIIVADTSVLINFLRIDRMDLIAGHSHDFLATDHVATEISDRYPDQRQQFLAALDAGVILETRVSNPEELGLFGSLCASMRLGAGECSAIALATRRGHILEIDDRVATRHAREADATLHILATQEWVFPPVLDIHSLPYRHLTFLAAAKARGKRLGRQPGQRPKSDRLAPKVLQAVSEGRSYRWIARDLGISKNTVLNIVRRHTQAG